MKSLAELLEEIESILKEYEPFSGTQVLVGEKLRRAVAIARQAEG